MSDDIGAEFSVTRIANGFLLERRRNPGDYFVHSQRWIAKSADDVGKILGEQVKNKTTK